MLRTDHQKPCKRSKETQKDLDLIQSMNGIVLDLAFKVVREEQPIKAQRSIVQVESHQKGDRNDSN